MNPFGFPRFRLLYADREFVSKALSFLLYYFLDWCNRAEVTTPRSPQPNRPIIDIFLMLRAGGKARQFLSCTIHSAGNGMRDHLNVQRSWVRTRGCISSLAHRVETGRIARREINNTCQPDYDTVIRWK